MIRWFSDNSGLVGLALSFVAIGLSVFTVVTSRRQQRDAAFARIHELLIQPDLQRGRRTLFAVRSAEDVPAVGTVAWDEANRALAMYETLGYYVAKGIVPPNQALGLWHHSIRDIRTAAGWFVEARRGTHVGGWRPWPYLHELMDRADRYRSDLSCCASRDEREPSEPPAS